jgi:hypothetical protein
MGIIKEYSRLSREEESLLEDYKGERYTLSDGKGNILEEYDTRDPELHQLVIKKDLKRKIALMYYQAYPQHKFDLARNGLITDAEEKKDILDTDAALKREYDLRKAKMQESLDLKDIDLAEEAALSDKYKVVYYLNWLTLGLTKRYVLEKVED